MGGLEATAYHEAGHAVAAIQLGVGIGRQGISIVREEDWSGFAHTRKGFLGSPHLGFTAAMRQGMEKKVIVMFAGEAAQRRFQPRSVRRQQASSDRHNAVDLASYLTRSNRELEAYLKWLHIRAEDLVANPICWKMIQAVAVALLDRKRLTATELEAIRLESFQTHGNSTV